MNTTIITSIYYSGKLLHFGKPLGSCLLLIVSIKLNDLEQVNLACINSIIIVDLCM